MGSFNKKLVLNVVADVKQAKEGLAEVKQGITDLFKLQQGSGRDIANGAIKAFDGLHDALQGVMPIATGVLDIAQKGIEMAQFAGQRQNLMRQVGQANLDALRAGTMGLVDDQTLLSVAAKGLQGDFKLTAEQMQVVAAAAVALHNKLGVNVGETIEKLTKALASGQTEALKEYGISLGETGTQAEKLGRAHQSLALLASSADATVTDSGTQVTQMLVTLKNVWDELKVELGEVVDVVATVFNGFTDLTVALGDAIGASAAWFVAGGQIAEANDEVYTSVRGVVNEVTAAAERQEAMNKAAQTGIDFLHRLGAEYAQVSEHIRQMIGDETEAEGRTRRFNQFKELNKLAQEADAARLEDAKKARAKEDELWKGFTSSLDKVMDHRLDLVKQYEATEKHAAEMTFGVWKVVNDNISDELRHRRDELQAALLPLATQHKVDPGIARLQAMARETMNSKKAFESLKASGLDAFSSLGVAAGTSLQAIISGNRAAHASLTEVFRQMLDQLGTEMQINALKYLAMGTAAIWLDPPAAAGYFAASGIFEAAALAAGVAERGVGAPSAGASSAGGGGGGGAPANDNTAGREAAGSNSGGSVTVIHQYMVNGYIGDEARLAREMERLRRKGEMTGVARPRVGASRG